MDTDESYKKASRYSKFSEYYIFTRIWVYTAVGVTVPLCSGMWSILIVLLACLVNAWFISKTTFRNVRSKRLRLTYIIAHSLTQIGLLVVCFSDQLKMSANGVIILGYIIIGCVALNIILDTIFILI
jgi:ABC-type iron transport system FetAB permease component